MKLNDAKSSVLNFLLSMKRKLVLCLSLASPLPASVQLSLTNINQALRLCRVLGAETVRCVWLLPPASRTSLMQKADK